MNFQLNHDKSHTLLHTASHVYVGAQCLVYTAFEGGSGRRRPGWNYEMKTDTGREDVSLVPRLHGRPGNEARRMCITHVYTMYYM